MIGEIKNTEENFTVDPQKIVKRIISTADALGLAAGQRMFIETERALGFVPWWDRVSIPVTRHFKRMRQDEQQRQDHLELAKAYAGATQQPVNMTFPSAQSAFSGSYGEGGLNINQMNLLEKGAKAVYETNTTQTDNIIRR